MKQGWLYEQKYKDSIWRYIFKEWIYANFEAEELKGIITLASASRVAGKIAVRTWENNVLTVDDREKFKSIDVERSVEDLSVRMGGNILEQISEDEFRLKGKTQNIEWNLTYFREAPVFEGFEKNIGWFKFLGENIGWQALMPKARVKGSVVIKGKTYYVDGGGYVDSNWGTWLIMDAHWNWLQCRGNKSVVSLFDIRKDREAGVLYVQIEDRVHEYHKENYVITHLDWEQDSSTGIYRPVRSMLEAKDTSSSLSLTIEDRLKNTFIEELEIPLLKPDWIMFESFCDAKGTFLDKTGGNTYPLHLKGIKEYGTHRFFK